VKTFKSLVVSTQPADLLWRTVRDRMPALAARLDDIERVKVLERQDLRDGTVRLVNEWRAKPLAGVPLKAIIGASSIVWLDHAEWNPASRICRWRIEPRFLPGQLQCHGSTTYEPAMGGRGSRILFEGQFELTLKRHSVASTVMSHALPLVESIVTVMIPKNFRRTVDAATTMLEESPPPD
jgi:hypothetical protein